MALNDEDLQYGDIVRILNNLRKVKTPSHFEADLMRKLNAEKYGKEKPQTFWGRLFAPARLIPSAALAVTTIVILFVVNFGTIQSENPLLINPRIREEVVATKDMQQPFLEKDPAGSKQNESSHNDSDLAQNRLEDNSGQTDIIYSGTSRAAFVSGGSINKSGLNFRGIRLSDEERIKLNELRSRLNEMLGRAGSN